MAVAFYNTDGTCTTTGRTLMYTAPNNGTVLSAVVFGGSIANIDNTNSLTHSFKLEKLKVDGSTYIVRDNWLPLPYNSSFGFSDNKIVLMPGESLYLTADKANTLQFSLDILLNS